MGKEGAPFDRTFRPASCIISSFIHSIKNESEIAAVIEDQFYGMFGHFHIKSRSAANANAVIKLQRGFIKYIYQKKREMERER